MKLKAKSFLAPIVLASLATPAPAQPAQLAPIQATVTVNFARSRGTLLRTERINNFTSADRWAEQRAADVKFYNEQGLHGSIYRVWVGDGPYNAATGTFDYSKHASYLDDASAMSDTILVNMNVGRMLKAGLSAEQMAPVLQTLVRDLKQRWPKIRYIEAFNEPDHGFAKLMKPTELYQHYVQIYRAVNTVNRGLAPKDRLQVGGPAFMMYNEEWMRAFLDGYAADRSPDKRLDFISYHEYGEFPPGTGAAGGPRAYDFYKSNPSRLASHRPKLDAELKSRGLDTRIPSFITETGLYPGPSFDDQKNPRADYIRQAAGMASYMYWFLEDPRIVPFNWVLRHQTEERKDQLLTRAGEGQPVPTCTFTPYGNQMLMFSKLKDERVAATSNALAEGKGVYSIASKDKSGAALVVWNYQHTGTQPYRVTIDMGQLPPSLHGKNLRQRMYRIDDRTSNYWGNPATANLQQVADAVVKPGKQHRVTVDLPANALHMVVLEPASGQAPKR